MNVPWSYVKLSQVMASVKSDLSIYDDAGMIDEDRVIKIIAECNEKLGQRIYKSRECKIQVCDFKAPLPTDLYKIENMFATEVVNAVNLNPTFGAKQYEFSSKPPKDKTKIITYGKMGCVDSCNNCYWVSDRAPAAVQQEIQYEKIVPLSLTDRIHSKLIEYSPCNHYKGEFKVDLNEEEFNFSFENGEVYLCYLGNLISEDGEIEIPFHPKLNPYYEYAIMEKILQDIFLNSDADVINKLKYVSEKKREAYAIAWDYANTRQVNEWSKAQKNIQRDYYNKWVKIFN